jgi:predicted ATPase
LPHTEKSFQKKLAVNENFYIVTGGPGVGKTTLLLELEKSGYTYIPEVAREIIQEQLKSGGDKLPWGNAESYRDLMLQKSVETYLSAEKSSEKILFFDRGIPDTLAYSNLINLPITKELENSVEHYRYNRKVLILPPWKKIYHTDDERKQDFYEAVRTFDALTEVYRNLDYELIEVPKAAVEKRTEFIIEILSK